MSLSFHQPLALLLLPPAAALVVYLWHTSRAYMPPLRRRVVLGLRLAVTALLVLVLADPQLQLQASHVSVAFLLDRSDSITPAGLAGEQQWLARALAAKRQTDTAAVLSFGQNATVERALSADPAPPRLGPVANFGGTRTDIAAAIQAGLAALPPDTARRIVLLSDGQENLGDAQAAARVAAAAGVPIVTVPISEAQGPEVLVRQVSTPPQVREGDRFEATAEVDSTVATSVTLHVMVDGQLTMTQQVSISPGSNRFALPVDPLKAGHHQITVEIEPDRDTLAQNNTAGALVDVSGPPKILVLEGQPGDGQYLAGALRANGLAVDLSGPSTAIVDAASLQGYAAVVLANVSANSLAAAQTSALNTYVQSYGGGLVVSGGQDAFGPGGYARSPLEQVLPVTMDLQGKTAAPSTALVLVIDNSGSMGEAQAGVSKMDLAKEAAIAAAQMLGPYDQIGVVAFDDTPRWAVPVTSAGKLDPVQNEISQMQAGGGTEIYPALAMAYQGLAGVDARVKHIILLTDGDAPSGDYPGLTAKMRSAGISLSTIGIGGDADMQLLQQLASMGNGRFYNGNDPFNVPQLVVRETQQVQRAAIVEQDTKPVPVESDSSLGGLDLSKAPPLLGYVATSPKPESTVLLAAPNGDPILTQWRYGLGRVVAWASDVRNLWAADWLQWPQFAQFWTQVVKRAARPPDDPNRQLSTSLDGNREQLTLDAVSSSADPAQRQYLNFLPTAATVTSPSGAETKVALTQTAPGRYQGSVPVSDEGVYAVQVVQANPNGSNSTVSGGFVVPYSPEYLGNGTNAELLSTLARLTGGEVARGPSDAFAHTLASASAPRALWPLLLVLCALLLVAEVAIRRIRLTGRDTRAAYAVVRERLGFHEADHPRAPRHVGRPPAPLTAAAAARSTSVDRGPSPPPPAAAPERPQTASGRLVAAKQRAARR